VLTTLVSVDPIYASFNADEQVVARALRSLADLGMATDVEISDGAATTIELRLRTPPPAS
jgi:multidrug efflux system membrane fusion protein